jgi:hypothetical protein
MCSGDYISRTDGASFFGFPMVFWLAAILHNGIIGRQFYNNLLCKCSFGFAERAVRYRLKDRARPEK